jgi:hypothetical protein
MSRTGRFISADEAGIIYLSVGLVGGANLYAYCFNNPIMETDDTGMWVDTVIDIAFIIWGIVDLIQNPTWGNAGWLALDIAFAVLPFLPNVGKIAKGGAKIITKADDIVDFSKIIGKGDDFVVIGQSMSKRVIPFAKKYGVSWYKGIVAFDKLANLKGLKKALWIGYVDNIGYIAAKTLSGAKFIDKGWDATRKTIQVANNLEKWSRITIISEKAAIYLFRPKNMVRLLYSVL